MALERSRSGKGGHAWLFFEEAITAALQDTLPQGGFGYLIALPLQKEPRDRGNSVFLDKEWLPHRRKTGTSQFLDE